MYLSISLCLFLSNSLTFYLFVTLSNSFSLASWYKKTDTLISIKSKSRKIRLSSFERKQFTFYFFICNIDVQHANNVLKNNHIAFVFLSFFVFFLKTSLSFFKKKKKSSKDMWYLRSYYWTKKETIH